MNILKDKRLAEMCGGAHNGIGKEFGEVVSRRAKGKTSGKDFGMSVSESTKTDLPHSF